MDHDTYFDRYGEPHPDDLARWCAEPEPQQPEPEQPEPEPTLEDLRDVIRHECARANASFDRVRELEAQVAALTETVRCAGETCNSIDAALQAAEEQVHNLRGALDWLRCDGVVVHQDPDGYVRTWSSVIQGPPQPAKRFFGALSAVVGVPVAHLTGETEEDGK